MPSIATRHGAQRCSGSCAASASRPGARSAPSARATRAARSASGTARPAAAALDRPCRPRTRPAPAASAAARYGLPTSQAKNAARHASCGFGCTIFTTSASDGALPTDAASKTCSDRAVQPGLHQLFRTRAQRLAAHGARAQDLHEVAQHLAVVDHAARTPAPVAAHPAPPAPPPATPACLSYSHVRGNTRPSAQ